MNEHSLGSAELLNGMFALAFLVMALWEARSPARPANAPMSLRWFGNIMLFGSAWLMVWALPFLTGYAAAVYAVTHGWGLLNLLPMPYALAMVASFVLLDLFSYGIHRLVHVVPLLWRLHAVHHSDNDLDVTTTLRHHPAETVVEMALDAGLSLLFGFPPEAIALYAGVVLTAQTFHHANVMLPARLAWLSRFVMTPDLHRLHHSALYAENNSNFGNLVSLWDRIFGTLRAGPEGAFQTGLPEFQDARSQRLDKLLIQPLLVVAAVPPARRVQPL